MKKESSIKDFCFFIILLFALQIIFMFIMRSSTPLSQEGGAMEIGSTSRRSALSLPSTQSQEDLQHKNQSKEDTNPIVCEQSNQIYDCCSLNSPSIFDPKRSTFFTINSYHPPNSPPTTVKIRPYPRKWEPVTMSFINEITLTTTPLDSSCEIYHDAPALVFSVSGFTGNFFHEFNDGIIPLFITINTLFDDQDVTLVVTNFRDWWYSKYNTLLAQFTKHHLLNLDNQTVTHCFPQVAVGLISHGPMTIDPTRLPSPKSFLDFRAKLASAYDKCHASLPPPLIKGKPRLIFMSRTGRVGRVILNEKNIIRAAKELGFDVVVYRPTKYTPLCESYRVISTGHAMMGVHGAALTHSLFLRPSAVLGQVVPLGTEWLADTYFKKLAVDGMKFEYLEYMIKPEESSLAEKYGRNHVMVRKVKETIAGMNWSTFDTIYVKGQDVRLDMKRFRGYLKIAYLKAKRFMEENG
ncbi:hypothetical protein Ancab_018754 [Ancistrocladus abbreviatus]